jgi:hypothetical protein
MKTPFAALLIALPLSALAEEAKPVGSDTHAWLELQQSGRQAVGTPRLMPGEIASNVYQRYVDSFKQPIPAEFKRQSTEGSSGSGGN